MHSRNACQRDYKERDCIEVSLYLVQGLCKWTVNISMLMQACQTCPIFIKHQLTSSPHARRKVSFTKYFALKYQRFWKYLHGLIWVICFWSLHSCTGHMQNLIWYEICIYSNIIIIFFLQNLEYDLLGFYETGPAVCMGHKHVIKMYIISYKISLLWSKNQWDIFSWDTDVSPAFSFLPDLQCITEIGTIACGYPGYFQEPHWKINWASGNILGNLSGMGCALFCFDYNSRLKV